MGLPEECVITSWVDFYLHFIRRSTFVVERISPDVGSRKLFLSFHLFLEEEKNLLRLFFSLSFFSYIRRRRAVLSAPVIRPKGSCLEFKKKKEKKGWSFIIEPDAAAERIARSFSSLRTRDNPERVLGRPAEGNRKCNDRLSNSIIERAADQWQRQGKEGRNDKTPSFVDNPILALADKRIGPPYSTFTFYFYFIIKSHFFSAGLPPTKY